MKRMEFTLANYQQATNFTTFQNHRRRLFWY